MLSRRHAVSRFIAVPLLALGLLAVGLGLLACLPPAPSDFQFLWRLALSGAGFGLFQSPNNHTIVTSAPLNRSGGASGMLGTARLMGQTTGAALVALAFNLFANHGTHACLLTAGILAALAAIVSLLRVGAISPDTR